MSESEPIKLYFDYKSPYAFLALQPAFDLPERFRVSVRWIPYLLRIKGKGERSIYSEWKARYSYMDARRWANRRGGFPIKGPQKVYDSTPALIGGLFAQDRGFFRPYTELVYARFFERTLEIDLPEAVAGAIEELGHSGSEYLVWAKGGGGRALRGLHRRGPGRSRLRCSALPLRRRAVLGARSDSPARRAPDRARPAALIGRLGAGGAAIRIQRGGSHGF